jgi:hypothetical protein
MSDAQVKGVGRTKVAGQVKARDQVRVLYGVHALEASLAGRMVSDVRQALRQALNISPQAVAVVDGHEVGETFVLLAGQQLEFVRLAGEKGKNLHAGAGAHVLPHMASRDQRYAVAFMAAPTATAGRRARNLATSATAARTPAV